VLFQEIIIILLKQEEYPVKRILSLVLTLCLCLSLVACDSSKYNEAINLFDSGNYQSALVIFESLGDYKSSKSFAQRCNYNMAVQLFEQKRYNEALGIFEKIKDFEDSSEYIAECHYNVAIMAFNNGDYSTAQLLLKELGTYKDSESYLVEIGYKTTYNSAVSLFNNGDFSKASNLFSELPVNYMDVDRYKMAISYLQTIVGAWSNATFTDKNDRGSVYIGAELKISGPYSIKESTYYDCEWGVFATVTLSVTHLGVRDGSLSSFIVSGKEVASYLKDKNRFDKEIILVNEQSYPYQTVFDSRNGVCSRIFVKLTTKSGKQCLELREIPYNMNWTKGYMDGGTIYLYK
jgi:tetratricopeptide (TPR) repeat protein